MLKEGKYTAKAIQGQFGESKEKKTPCVAVLFEFNQGTTEMPDIQKEWWTGWLSEKALERTIETLALCGYDDTKGNNPDGSVPAEYFNGNEVQITIEAEEYTGRDGSTKTAMKIKWVNQIGGSQFAGQDPTVVKNVISNINLKGSMAAARAKLGIKAPTAKPYNHAPGASNPPPPLSDEAPF